MADRAFSKALSSASLRFVVLYWVKTFVPKKSKQTNKQKTNKQTNNENGLQSTLGVLEFTENILLGKLIFVVLTVSLSIFSLLSFSVLLALFLK